MVSTGLAAVITGISHDGIDTKLRAFGVPEDEWWDVLEKIAILTPVYVYYRNQKLKNTTNG